MPNRRRTPRRALALAAALGLLFVAAVPASASAKPKLALGSLELAPSAVPPAGSFAIAGKLRNRGRRAAAPTIQVFSGGSSTPRTLLGERRLEVGPHSRRAFTLQAQAPASFLAGSYRVIACIVRRNGGNPAGCRTLGTPLTVEPLRTSDPVSPADSDGDGLPDSYDLCPGQAGPVGSGGCPQPDSDGDEVPDAFDVCPAVAGLPPSGCPAPQPPSPGARTAGDPVFPEVGNGGYDVQHYDVELNWTLPDNFTTGTATTITAEATQSLSEFSLDLEGLTVSDVKVNGVTAGSSRVAPVTCTSAPPCGQTKLVITPATPIDSGDEFTVEVEYTGNPQRHSDPDGSDEGWNDTPDGAFVVNEPIGAMTWMPSNNHPSDRASYDFELTVPLGKTAIGNGELVGSTNNGATTTWHWASEATLPTYLSTATIGNFTLDQSTTTDGLPIYDLIDTASLAVGMNSLTPEPGILDFFSVLYGPYPFDSAGAVVDNLADPAILYALEVQTKPHFPIPVVDPITLAHEISHQWFGDSVTLTTWKDIWLNEGWATWSEWEWDFAENAGTSPAAQFNTNYTAGSGSCPGTNKWCTPPTDPSAEGLFDTFPVYTRGGMMLEALHQILGDQKFFSLARSWQSGHRHGHGTTAGFIALAKQTSGFTGAELTKLDTFFQQWLYGTTMPTITGANFFTP